MGTKMVRLDEGLYERIEAHKMEDESFSEAIDRLIDDWTILEYDTGRTGAEIDAHREAIEASERAGIEEIDELLERMASQDE